MIVSSDAALLQRARELRTYGWRERDLSRVLGYNSRLDELQAALLRTKLSRLGSWNDRRKAIAEQYSAGLSGLSGLSIPAPANGHAWHLYVVRVSNRDAFRDALASRGIGTGVHYPYPVHSQPAFKELSNGRAFPHAEAACQEIVSLPIFPQLTADETSRVVNAIREILGGR
jgi:dTDP-4-amino-4,6-dideoxygalactose transaminase